MLVFLLLVSGYAGLYEPTPCGIVIHPADGSDVMISAYGDSIIRVTALPTGAPLNHESLMVVSEPSDATALQVAEGNADVTLFTAQVRVSISRQSGAVSFFDVEGDPILIEPAGGGKTLAPATVMGGETYHIRQVFESPTNEAFDGLSQHQNGLMNCRGHRIDLRQYNLAVAVPFLVASRNYGILWDNNSRTIFGDPRECQPLSATLKLSDSAEKAADPIRLCVYSGSDGAFGLYEDGARALTVGTREGSFPGMLDKRTFEVVWIGPDHAPDAVVEYDGHEVFVTWGENDE
ncbi:MAG: DUF4968 domain-containing protein [Pontiellaceae bacterium]|nr:DUF4968 domain-containing protein [Pontiellaceae bacterium]MBN2783344.1 DUF4968 domain-containing protein [Pontiellaceae bacterium]